MSYDPSHLVTLDALKSLGTAVKSKIDKCQSDVDKLTGIYAVKGTQASGTNAWTGSLALDALYDGLTIQYYLPYAGSGDATLNLTLTGGASSTTTGAIKVYMTGNTRMSTQYGAGSTITLTYWGAGSISIEGTATSEARWTSADYSQINTYTEGTGIDISNQNVISIENSGVTAGSYGPSSDASPSAEGTFTVPYVTVDATGRVTAAADKTITLPADADSHVGVTKAETTKAYLLGTSTTPTTTEQDVVAVADTGVYLDTTAGHLTATQFNGSAAGLNLGSTSGNAVYTTTDGKLVAGSLAVSDPTASGTAASFISGISQDAKGQITATKAGLPSATSSAAGVVTLSDATDSTSGAADGVAATPAAVKAVMDVAGSAMRFKGTVGTGGTVSDLPSNAKVGDTYKVITDGTYGGIACKVGDTLICKTAGTNQEWVMIPSGDEPGGTVTSITLKAGSGIALDVDDTPITTSGARTISHGDTSSASSIVAASRTYVDSVTLDDYGHVTALSTSTETVTDTHYTSDLVVAGSASAKVNTTSALTNGNVYLNHVENDAITHSHQITGAGATEVTSDSSGNLTITSTDHTYDPPTLGFGYAACTTAGATAAKTANMTGYELTTGGFVSVKFNNGITVADATLSINSQAAKPIYFNNAALEANIVGSGDICTFVYDGSYYRLVSIDGKKLTAGTYGPTADVTGTNDTTIKVPQITVDAFGRVTAVTERTLTNKDTDTTYTPASLGFGYATCSTAAATAAKEASLTGYELVTGGFVAVKFTNAVPADATLSINSQTAKAIRFNGAAIPAGTIHAGDLATFVYDGTYYHLVSIQPQIVASDAEITEMLEELFPTT